MKITLEFLNTCAQADFVTALQGIYEHSPWIPERAATQRPFINLNGLKLALQNVVTQASHDEQLGLIRAHPELAGKAAIAGTLTGESTNEQTRAGLNRCSEAEFAILQKLNADYNARFSFPFILAIRGGDGNGLPRSIIIATFARRLKNQIDDEMMENLRQIHRIAELRLNDLLGFTPQLGNTVMQHCQVIGAWSDHEEGLTCAYMTAAHRRTALQLMAWMEEAGMQAHIDAVGNVVGRYLSDDPDAKTLLTGSHYDTVCNGGKYDGRAGILLPVAVVEQLHKRGEKLPYHLEVIGFAEEEGVRFQSTFLGSSAVAGRFDMALLDRQDANGISMRQSLHEAGHDSTTIPTLARHKDGLLGFVEIHIEQGPVLIQKNLPTGIVTSIAGSCRYQIELTGVASHAGTTPMAMRKDAAAAAAEIVLSVERRCSQEQALVGTVGQLHVPNGSVNVIPGLCRLSLDVRAAEDAVRDAVVADILQDVQAICLRRHIEVRIEQTMKAAAVPCAPWLMQQLSAATERAGLPVFLLSSGAGHDAMMLAGITDVAMLFIRCGNGGISHNPLEIMTNDDGEIAANIFMNFLKSFTPIRR